MKMQSFLNSKNGDLKKTSNQFSCSQRFSLFMTSTGLCLKSPSPYYISTIGLWNTFIIPITMDVHVRWEMGGSIETLSSAFSQCMLGSPPPPLTLSKNKRLSEMDDLSWTGEDGDAGTLAFTHQSYLLLLAALLMIELICWMTLKGGNNSKACLMSS